MEEDKGVKSVRAVERTLEILTLYIQEQKELGISEISRALDLSKATVNRLILTLEQAGFLVQNPVNQKYGIGSPFFLLGGLYNSDLKSLALPIMSQIVDECHETVQLSVMDGDARICLEALIGTHELAYSPRIGIPIPINSGSSSKLLLAFQSKERIKKILNMELPKLTERTIVDPAVLMGQLKQIRQKGYSISEGERQAGVTSLAAPIYNREGQVIACLAIGSPSIRCDDRVKQQLLRLVLKGAQAVSEKMGYRLSK